MIDFARQLKIKNKAAELANGWRAGDYDGETVEDILIRMARWADQSPVNPWHNVNDRMPNDHEKIFFRKNDGSKYCGWFDEKMQSFFTITPDVTKWTINGVTHWMKVPDMPADILDK